LAVVLEAVADAGGLVAALADQRHRRNVDRHELVDHAALLRRPRGLGVALVTQLPAHGAEDARAARLLLVVDQDGGVLVEADVAAVGTALLLLRAHDNALDDVTLLDGGAGDGVLDG